MTERFQYARHEAGHATAAFLLGLPIVCVFADERRGWFEHSPEQGEPGDMLKMIVAGDVVDSRYGRLFDATHFERRQPRDCECAKQIIEASPGLRNGRTIGQVLACYWNRTRALLQPHSNAIEGLALRLMVRNGLLVGSEVRRFLMEQPGLWWLGAFG